MIRNIMAAPLIKAIVELQTMYGKFSQEKNMVFITRVFLTLVAGLLNLSFHSSGGLASGRLDQSQIHSVPGSLDSWSSLFGLWGLLGLPWAEDSLLFARDGLRDSFWASINSFSTSEFPLWIEWSAPVEFPLDSRSTQESWKSSCFDTEAMSLFFWTVSKKTQI